MPEESPAARPGRVAKGLAALLVRLFFREIAVEGAERIPPEGPLVYAVNHPNALVDPLLILGTLPRAPRFLARHGLFGMAVLRPLLRLAGALPVYRAKDAGAETARNLQTFDACYDELGRGGVVALFPEGVSHTEPSMVPIKSGVSRIVLGAAERHPGLGLTIVPVGLLFDAKDRFRSRTLVKVGDPLDPAREVAMAATDPRGARNSLTLRVEAALRAVTLNYPSWREARLLERGADLFLRSGGDLPTSPGPAERFSAERRLIEGYAAVKEAFPDRVAGLARSVETYDRLLRQAGLRDGQVVSSYPRGQVAGYVIRTLGRLLIYLPLAAVGTLLNWFPYRLIGLFAGRYERNPEQPATKKLLGGLFAYPTFWILETILAALWRGSRWALAVALLAPLSGYVAMRFHEERRDLWDESRVFLLLRTHRDFRLRLRARREALSRQVTELAADYRRVSKTG